MSLSVKPTGAIHLGIDGKRQSVLEHLIGVSKLAGEFAEDFRSRKWGEAAGLFHDVGKYSDDFQRYLRKAVENPDSVRRGEVDHSSAGAILASKKGFHALDYVVAGHHSGLPDSDKIAARLSKKDEFAKVSERLPDAVNAIKLFPPPSGLSRESLNMWARLLFSSLVDADWLDTEAFASGGRTKYGDTPARLLEKLNAHVGKMSAKSPKTKLNERRNEIFLKCSEAGKSCGSMFSLTVPTGYGKTLSSLAFALNYAVRHGKKRVIVAIPFTGIITQTAAIFRSIFGAENVLEHHSGIDFSDADAVPQSARFASENWDIPIVITTNVRFFETLYAASPSKCRRLHNICESVVVLDEAQMLPPELLLPILVGIDNMAKIGGTAFLFCTATQPVFGGRIGSGAAAFDSPLPEIVEIADNYRELFAESKRAEISLESAPDTYDSLAEKLRRRESSWLCIVNTRAHAYEIASRIPEAEHLSRSMCSAHIAEVLERVKSALTEGKCVRLVGTQLMEAGVDIDFPEVYREFAGLDSVVQAAGRCNREGKLALGKVGVFKFDGARPFGMIGKSAAAFAEIIDNAGAGARIDSPENISAYFKRLYGSVNDFDSAKIKLLLWSCVSRDGLVFDFESAAAAFKLVDDSGGTSVVVPYSSSFVGDEAERLAEFWRGGNAPFSIARKLQRYSVSVRKREFDTLKARGAVAEINGLNFLIDSSLYDNKYGLTVGNNKFDELLII